MLFDIYKCSRCAYKQKIPEDLFTVTHYLYRLPSGFFFEAGATRGWCNECSRISWVETLSIEHIQKYSDRLILLEQTIAQDISKSLFARLKERYQNRQTVKQLSKLMSLILLREHPKCFSCGTAMTSKMDLEKKMIHSCCGGTIARERYDDGVNWDYDPKHVQRFYSAAGTFLFEERK